MSATTRSNRDLRGSPVLSQLSPADKVIADGTPPTYSDTVFEGDLRAMQFHCPMSRQFPTADDAIVWDGARLRDNLLPVYSDSAIISYEAEDSNHCRHPVTRQTLTPYEWDNRRQLTYGEQTQLDAATNSYSSRDVSRNAFSNYQRCAITPVVGIFTLNKIFF